MHTPEHEIDMREAEQRHGSANRYPLLTLLSAVALILGLWGVVLPRLADHPSLRAKIQHLEHRGIDSNAFFYTDHPAEFQAGLKQEAMISGRTSRESVVFLP